MVDSPQTNGKPRNAEQALGAIAGLTYLERRRLGAQLAQSDLLPCYRVVTAKTLEDPNEAGLTGKPALLFYYCAGTRRREGDIIRHLWPADARASKDVRRDKRLRARLRQLQKRTNETLLVLKSAYQLRRQDGALTVAALEKRKSL